jgi:hypothetical protein
VLRISKRPEPVQNCPLSLVHLARTIELQSVTPSYSKKHLEGQPRVHGRTQNTDTMHHHRASRLLEETLMEMETTTTPVVVRATTRSARRSQRDGSLDPSLATSLAFVTSMTLSTPCCVGPLTDTLGPSSTIV